MIKKQNEKIESAQQQKIQNKIKINVCLVSSRNHFVFYALQFNWNKLMNWLIDSESERNRNSEADVLKSSSRHTLCEQINVIVVLCFE